MKEVKGIKRKDMQRSDWHRILEREYRWKECSYHGKRGIASVLMLKQITEPLTIRYEHGDVTIVNKGDTWVQIALEDTFFWATAMFDQNDRLLQIYFDITSGNCLEKAENPTFEDLYLDIVLEPDGTLHILDRDELDDALKTEKITLEQYQMALAEGERLYTFLKDHWSAFADFCREQMLLLKGNNEHE